VGFNPGIVRTVPRMENDPLHPCNNIDGGGCSSSSSAAHPMDVDDGDDVSNNWPLNFLFSYHHPCH
tara:strand:- start:630 stop:827 length:198 start_codon:yes stop_codon:yes gene_type:complete